MSNKAERNTLKPIGLYHTYETVAELSEYVEKLSVEERALAYLIMGLTWNTCAHLTQEETK